MSPYLGLDSIHGGQFSPISDNYDDRRFKVKWTATLKSIKANLYKVQSTPDLQ